MTFLIDAQQSLMTLWTMEEERPQAEPDQWCRYRDVCWVMSPPSGFTLLCDERRGRLISVSLFFFSIKCTYAPVTIKGELAGRVSCPTGALGVLAFGALLKGKCNALKISRHLSCYQHTFQLFAKPGLCLN